MQTLWEGIQTGLILCFLIGPIFFTLIQTGVERGFRAGAAVGLGIWMSDMMFVLLFFSGVKYIARLMEWDGFEFYVGIAGSIILAGFGLAALSTKPAFKNPSDVHFKPASSYLTLWVKGFLINVVNPFTILFWFGLMTSAILKEGLDSESVLIFFGGTIGTVIFTDLIKILLAKRIRRWMKPKHILLMRRISGIALILFGIVLLVRSIVM